MLTRRKFLHRSGLLLAWAGLNPRYPSRALASTVSADSWNKEFQHPPPSAYPWAFVFWVQGNVTKEGITADLESMHRAGIRGMELFLCVDLESLGLGVPAGPYQCLSEGWFDLFGHLLKESDRLGIEIDVNNSPDWDGSGGAWIPPEMASQQVIASETVLEGPVHKKVALPMPKGVRKGYYQEIAVLAFPLQTEGAPTFRIPNFNSSKSFAGGEDFYDVIPWPRLIRTNPAWPRAPQNQVLDASRMIELTSKLERDGTLAWDVPVGRWLVLRFGHTVANGTTRVSEPHVAGLECDKMRKSAIQLQFDAMIGKLVEHAGPLTGKVLTTVHVDSWEAGSGNWTPGFRKQFQSRRGYDMLPYLATLNGLVVESREVSERFLWDLRETIHELVVENYATHLRDLAHSRGMKLSIEAYDGTCDDLRYAGCADIPMTEFWPFSACCGLPMCDHTEDMASAAHVYGKPILSSEAFTSIRGDFLAHPATLKPLGDWAFCTGVNRLSLSEWVMQPWPQVAPGISFGLFGTVFQRSLTWWPMARPWNDYTARCQWMLQQGTFVADVCFIAPEGAPSRYTPPIRRSVRGVIPDRPEYNFDGCPGELVIEQMTTEDHAVLLPSGMKYSLLVLPTYDAGGEEVIRLLDLSGYDNKNYYYKPEAPPKVQTMTPELLWKVVMLLKQGATVLGYRPLKSPSLNRFPECDEDLTRLADEVWGPGQGGSGKGRRKVGRGQLFWGWSPEDVLKEIDIPPDFRAVENLQGILNYTHRRLNDGSDIYFVVNQKDGPVQGTAEFRATGDPELYWPETGTIRPALAFSARDKTTRMPLSLDSNESVFVIFRRSAQPVDPVISITRDGERLLPAAPSKPVDFGDSFEIAAWMYPSPGPITLPEPCEGGWEYKSAAPRIPARSDYVVSSPGRGIGGFAMGTNGILVFQYGAEGEVEPLLVYEKQLSKQVLVGVIYREKIPRLYLNGQLVKTGPRSRFPVSSGGGWADWRPFACRIAELQQFEAMLRDSGMEDGSGISENAPLPAIDFAHRKIWASGGYAVETARGQKRHLSIRLPHFDEIRGPWDVEFDPETGGAGHTRFAKLADWSKHENPAIRYYSGTAIYRKEFPYQSRRSSPEEFGVDLDLGNVASLAAVTLNDEDLGILWKPPYRVDVSHALREGKNTLEIRVVNMWVNRLIGDENLPEDCERNAAGGVKKWPQWILEGKKSPTGRHSFVSQRLWSKSDPLLPSGLLGPVRLRAFRKI